MQSCTVDAMFQVQVAAWFMCSSYKSAPCSNEYGVNKMTTHHILQDTSLKAYIWFLFYALNESDTGNSSVLGCVTSLLDKWFQTFWRNTLSYIEGFTVCKDDFDYQMEFCKWLLEGRQRQKDLWMVLNVCVRQLLS